MKIEIKDGSPDGMHLIYHTYIMTWKELHKFLEFVEKIESGGLKKE